jgi:uncharacterized protein YndB with AHSA1/START domain
VSADPRLVAVRERVEVDCPIQEAFDLFTTRMGEWWPLDPASYGGERANEIFLEPRVGGRFYERFTDGDELQVGSVVACEPPRRIAFTWRTADWEGETEVEVTFTPSRMGPGSSWSAAGSNGWDRSVPTPRPGSATAGRACRRPTQGEQRRPDPCAAGNTAGAPRVGGSGPWAAPLWPSCRHRSSGGKGARSSRL